MRDTLCKHLCCPDCRRDLVLEPTERDGDEIMTDGRVTWIHRNSWAAVGVRAAAA